MIELPSPRYMPFMDSPDVVQMGLAPLLPENWIEPDAQFLDYYDNKKALVLQFPDRVFGELPGSTEAQQEFADRLLVHLLNHHGRDYATQRSLQNKRVLQLKTHKLTLPIDAEESVLWNAGLWIQDDICILQERGGQHHLTAASLCAPSAWRLQDKLDRPMFEIHEPVPGLNSTIGPQIDHVLGKLSPLRPFQRFNWSIKSTNDLALFPDQSQGNPNAGLFLRVERQTLTRLPKTNAIAFTIRVYVDRLDSLTPIPGAVYALQRAVNQMSAAQAKYKSLPAIFRELRAFFKENA